jgi:hypothetical protein
MSNPGNSGRTTWSEPALKIEGFAVDGSPVAHVIFKCRLETSDADPRRPLYVSDK